METPGGWRKETPMFGRMKDPADGTATLVSYVETQQIAEAMRNPAGGSTD